MKRQLPNKMVGKAWVGVWSEKERRLGWAMPNFVNSYSVSKLSSEYNPWATGEFWLCKVTIELLKDKRGRAYKKVF